MAAGVVLMLIVVHQFVRMQVGYQSYDIANLLSVAIIVSNESAMNYQVGELSRL